MPFSVSSVSRAASLYDLQKTYSERVKAYKSEGRIVQLQRDRITLSPVAVESLARHRRQKPDRQTIYYSNPKVTNAR
jgi:hypothetical protein